MRSLRTTLLSLLVLPLGAQGFSVTGSFILPLESLKKATNGSSAYSAGFDYETRLYGTDVPARAGLAFAAMPGSEKFGLKTSLTLVQLHGDIYLTTPNPKLRGLVGISFNSYSQSRTGTEDTADALDIDHHFPMHDVKGVKLGLRLGLDYRLAKNWSMELLFQQTELAGKDLSGDITDPNGVGLVRQGGINPGWLQLGATFRF
jgi:hypothetical protein